MEIRKEFLPFSRPSINDADVEAVVRCLRSGWITTGPLCQRFEEGMCRLTGAPRAVAVSSATAGMHLLLTALGIGPGDEVLTPSLTFASTINLIAMTGAKPVFVDVEYGTLNMDMEHLAALVGPRSRAVIPVHFAGAPVAMERLLHIARRHDLVVIEDAAHALGTRYGDIHAGGFGYPAVFSFHPIKNITTGEGGIITVFTEEWEKKLRLLRFHGIERDAWKRYGVGGNPEYDVAEPGYKYNLTDIQAALGVSQLARLEALNARRAALARLYFQVLEGTDGLDLPAVPPYAHTHSWHLFIVKVRAMDRGRFLTGLSRYHVGYGLHFPAAHLLTHIRQRYGCRPGMLPVTEEAAERIVSLPLYPDMAEDDVLYVGEAVKALIRDEGGSS